MAQPDRNSQRDNKNRGGNGGEPSFNWRGVILIAIAFALIGLAVVFRGTAYANVEDVPLPKFYELLDAKQIDKNSLTLVVPEAQQTQSLVGIYYKQPGQPVKFKTTVYLALTKNLRTNSTPPAFSRRSSPTRTLSARRSSVSCPSPFFFSFFIFSSASRSA